MNSLFFVFFLFGFASSACLENDKRINGLCFKFVNQSMYFEDARDYCHRLNAFLAYVPDLATSNLLASYSRTAFGTTNGYVWIGLSKNGSYQWDNGQPVGFTNFGGNIGLNYVGLSVSDGKWYTSSKAERYFICSYDQNSKPCTPSTPRLFFYAYSTDLDPQYLKLSFQYLPQSLGFEPIWKRYASARFDMKDQESVKFSASTQSFAAMLNSHQPDPYLGFRNSTIGSNMFDVIRSFLNKTDLLCGSTILIAAKRYPNSVEVEDLIADLQKNHIFVYVLASDTPSGGNNPSAMFNVASRTNGYCMFSSNSGFAEACYKMSDALSSYPHQIVSQRALVSGKGARDFSFTLYNGRRGVQTISLMTTFQDHKMDGSTKSMGYYVSDRTTEKVNLTTGDTGFRIKLKDVKDEEENFLEVNYEYVSGRQEVLEVRVYSEQYVPDNWQPVNN